jgi:hypothetical protein
MNERIRQLAEQAGFFPMELTQVGPSVEKFAELIVRECCDQVRMIDAMEIKRHFEVEP